jgi:hypothetical protein
MVKNHAVCCSDENEVCLTTCAIAQTRGEALMTSDEMTFEASPSLRPCLDALQKLKFFHSLSITSIFRPMHEVVNVGKKNN